MVYVGSKTGRDGIHGATMASAEFAADAEEKRPTVQVGDPFTEKLLIEACLELMATDAIVAIQDMGAAGLTSSSVEMAGKGGVGIELDLDQVPARETGMTAYEFMLSESQERMLMVLRPDREDAARAIFEKWELDFAVIGHLTDTGRIVVRHQGEVEADIPLAPLADQAPLYHRPTTETQKREKINPAKVEDRVGLTAALWKLVACPDLCLACLGLGPVRQHRRRPDGEAAGRGRRRGGEAGGPVARAGADHRLHAALLRRRSGSRRQAGGGRGMAQPDRGGRAAAGAHRQHEFRQSRSGRRSWASSPPRSAAWRRRARRSISRSCPAMSACTTRHAILRAPCAPSCRRRRSAASACWTMRRRRSGIALGPWLDVVLIGATKGWLGQSLWLREIAGREEGAPPPVDLAAERADGRFRPRPDPGRQRPRLPRRIRRRAAGRGGGNGDGRR